MRLDETAALILLAIPGPPGFSENTYEHLQALELVRKNSEANWEITERGRVFIDHLQGLALPEQTTAWRMPDRYSIPGSTAHWIDEDTKPPPAPPLRPKRVIPTDPEELRLEALRLMDAGFGMNEVKEQLELTEPQAQQFFFGK